VWQHARFDKTIADGSMVVKKSILYLALFSWAPAASGQEIVALATRPQVTQSYFLAKVPTNPQAAALLFPGAAINLRRENDEIKFAPNNILVRGRGEFIERDVIAALIDTPTEAQSGAAREQEFRLGADHVADVAAVVRDLKRRFPGMPLFLIGNSMGTLSAAAAGAQLGDAIGGVVLTSTLLRPVPRNARRPGPGLSRFDFASIKAPLLFVHHVSDQCGTTPYGEAARFAERYPLITVFGGAAPQSGPCEVFSQHNFYGKDGKTVEQIVNWMVKKPFQSEVK
jgi:serine aminopeptidase S33 family